MIDRPDLISCLLRGGLALLLLTILAGPVAADDARPNILWLSCEDISPHLGCYGDRHAVTPNIDSLAKRGVRYDQAFATAGVCAPCRSSIITGMYQTSIGTHHMRSSAQLPEWLTPFPILLRRAGYYCTNNSKTDYQFKAPKETWDQSSRKAHWRNRPDPDQPFFSIFNFTECHESGIASDDKYRKVTEGQTKQDPSRLTTYPPYYPETPQARADWGRHYDVVTAMDRRVGELLKQLEEDQLTENTIVVFWSDHGVGLPRAKRWVYDSGIRVPFIVAAPPKWRSLVAEADGASDRLVSLIDLGPTTLSWAGLAAPDWMQGRAFAGEHAQPPRAYIYAARDRMDERYDIIRAVRDKRFKYIRNYEPYKPYLQYINTAEKGRLMQEIRRVADERELTPAGERLMANQKPTEELYDTIADPHEIHNLASNHEFAEHRDRLRETHLRWVVETRDLGLIPEPIIAAREAEANSRHSLLQGDDGVRLIARLREASSDSLAGVEAAAKMDEHCQADDAAVRYWGAIGLGNLSPKLTRQENNGRYRKRLERMLDDPSPTVRVAAARAIARSGDPATALPVLTEVLRNGAQWERLHAIIVLDELDEAARPALPAIREALKYRDGFVARGKYVVRVANRTLNELLDQNNTVP